MVVISCYSLERDNQNAHPKLLHFADVMYIEVQCDISSIEFM